MSSQNNSPANARRNPYKAQRLWPPDFSKMDPKHQFRLERRYKRRTKLAYLRPRWIKGVKLAQYGSIAFVLGYGVLYMDWGNNGNPFEGVRSWFKETTASFWSKSTTQPQRPSLGRISSMDSKDQ